MVLLVVWSLSAFLYFAITILLQVYGFRFGSGFRALPVKPDQGVRFPDLWLLEAPRVEGLGLKAIRVQNTRGVCFRQVDML